MDGLLVWSPGTSLDEIEKQVILKAFQHYRGNKTVTANALGIAKRTLDAKLEQYDVDAKAEKERFDNESRRRSEYLARARGQSPNQSDQASVPSSAPGPRMESAPESSSQSPMSMHERSKVQAMLPSHSAQGHSRKAR